MFEPGYTPLPLSRLSQAIRPPIIVDLMSRALANPDVLSLAAGFTDNEVLPRVMIRDIVAELTREGLPEEPLQYGQNRGREGLRALSCRALAGHPGEQASGLDPEKVFITNGSQQALYLAMQALCDPGDIVLVEEPSYFVCLELLKGLRLRPVGIPCDARGGILTEGLRERLRALDAAGERSRVKAIYLVSYFCNPSSHSLGAVAKAAVAGVLSEEGFCLPVIEDAAYRDLYFEAPHPAPSILSMEAFAAFPKLYLGTYTKPFATGLKVGFGYCTHPVWLEKMLCMKGHQDFGTSHFNQAIIERVLAQGFYAEHLAGVRAHYAAKATMLNEVLEKGGLQQSGWRWERPAGGLVIWLRGPAGMHLGMESDFCARCIAAGVLYVPGDLCFAEGVPKNCARLAFGSLPPDKLRVAAERFCAVAAEFSA